MGITTKAANVVIGIEDRSIVASKGLVLYLISLSLTC